MQLTFGTGGRFARFSCNDASKIIDFSLRLGITSFDTGFEYGSFKSQPLLANCLKKYLISNRENLILSTKCSPISASYIQFAVQKSINTFKCGYIDYFHLWGASSEDLENKEILSVVKTLLKKGKIKRASVTTQDIRTIRRISKGNYDEIKALMLDFNLLKQNRLRYIKECRKNDIKIFAGTSLCQGFLIDSIFRMLIRSRSPFYFSRTFLKKETRNYLYPAMQTRKFLKKEYGNLYKKIPLSFVINEKLIDFVPIGMLSKKSLKMNVEIFNNPIDKNLTKKASKWAAKNFQVNDVV